jgi:hypothetical protein
MKSVIFHGCNNKLKCSLFGTINIQESILSKIFFLIISHRAPNTLEPALVVPVSNIKIMC